MVKVKPTANQGRITVKTSNDTNIFSIKDNLSEYYAKQAENWAHSEGMVNGIDYSSKYYAEQSKASAQVANEAKTETQYFVQGFDNKVQVAKDDIEQVKTNSINTINNAYNFAVEDMQEKSEGVLTSIEVSKAEVIDSINSTKTTILNDIEFVADGEKQEIENLIDIGKDEIQELTNEIKDNADTIINRVGFNMFDTVIKDHVLTYEESKGLALQGTYVYKDAIAGSRYGYADFYNKCLEERDEAIANGGVQKVTLGGTSMSMYIHPNGHMYYDISMKATVDRWFNTFGTAWFYGVDIENKRIFLPRNNYFEQTTTNSSEVGKSVEAGLPNHNHTLSLIRVAGNGWGTAQPAWGGDDAKREAVSATTDNASVSNSIYGKSNTVQPNAVKKLLYICVGNQVQDLSTIDIVTQVDNGVKEIDDAYNKAMSTLQAVGPVLQTGSTMTGDITFKKSTNTWSGLQVNALGEAGVIPTSAVLGGRLISLDNKNVWWATVQQSLEKDGASHIWLCSRNTSDGVTYKNHTLSIKSYPNGSGGTYIDGKLVKAHITESYSNGTSWYRIYSDGWCEQGGVAAGGTNTTGNQVSFLKKYKDTNYSLYASGLSRQADTFANAAAQNVRIRALTTTGFYASTSWVSNTSWGYHAYDFSWLACGYIA